MKFCRKMDWRKATRVMFCEALIEFATDMAKQATVPPSCPSDAVHTRFQITRGFGTRTVSCHRRFRFTRVAGLHADAAEQTERQTGR